MTITMSILPALVLCIIHVSSMKVEKSYRDQRHLQQFVIDKNSGEIYVGGQNALIRLSPELYSIQLVENGPRLDSPLCPPPQIPCNLTKNSINSFTKGLVIDYERETIIVCSNIYQGSCQIRLMKDISFVKKEIYKPIVGHIPESSDVLLIAPGINKNVLYVGSKYNNINQREEMKVYRDMVPHLSSRDLENLEFSFRDQNGGTKIFLLENLRADFQVNFLFGFNHENYVYFITTQAKSVGDNTVQTNIMRICHQDKYFRSYVEIPLLCYKDNNKPYVFAKGAYFEESSSKLFVIYQQREDEGMSSALCRYSLPDIIMMFDKTVEQCQDGLGFIGPPHMHIPTPCPKSSEPKSFCGDGKDADKYPSIEGRNPITEVALIEFPDLTLTSVLASKKDLIEVIFLGSSNGQLKKLIVSPGNQVTVVKEIDIDIGQPITKLEYNHDKSKVYALSSNKLLLVNPLHCGERTTCSECSVGVDPVCGWCVMENRCTEVDACPRSSVVPHWLMQTSCAKMVEIQPTSLSYETIEVDENQKQIQFKLDTIMLTPHSDNLDLQCSFVSMTMKTKTAAMIEKDVIKCPLPDQLPVVKKDYHDIEVEFHIEGHPIVKRSVPLYDCRVHDSCTDCANSNFTCMWKYQDNTCISTTTNTASKQANGITNADECPRVESPSSVTEVVVHSGESKQIAVRAINLKTEQRDNIHCIFEYLSMKKVVSGSISSSSLTCDTVQFDFNTKDLTPSVIAKFKITWGQDNYVLDNPTGISVRIFKCPLLVTNCGQCLSLQPEYECGWCGTFCSLQKHCYSTWQDRSATCQNPQILRFSPSVGPVGGKTNVSITGINLGKTSTDIQSGVTVAGVRCTVLPEHYQPSFMFKCETEPSTKVSSGPVQVTVGNMYTAISHSNFSFVEPEVLFLNPRKGPRSGGTQLTIGGNYLNAGTSVTVDVGGSPCQVTNVEERTLTCLGSAQTGNDEAEVEVSFGGYKRLLSSKFTYVDDPEILSVNPRASILSGGIKIAVVGQRLEMVQRAEFFVEVGDKKITSMCSLKDINGYTFWLTCKTPALHFPGENITVNNPKDVHYGFNLDGVTTYRNISLTFGAMEYYPDPIVHMFDGDDHRVEYKKGQQLIIKGNFQSIHHITDKKVYVGRTECRDIFTSDTTLNCTAPDKPLALDREGNAKVFIQIGHFQKEIGYVSYYEAETEDKPIALGIILGVVIPITAIILLLAFCIIKRQRKNGPTKKNAIPDMLKDYDTVKEEEDIGLVSVKADLNGQIPYNDSGPYISELLSRITDDAVKQNISTFLIARSQLDIGDLIGKGCYGNTYKVDYKAAEDKESKEVAIKVLQGFPTDTESIDNFVQHMVTFRDMQHTNILPYIGVCLGAVEDPILVSSYIKSIDLKSHVKDTSKNLTVADLLEICEQIADGMVYLQDLKIIHGNLAARNCILTNDNQIKITDYGYAHLFTADSFSTEDDDKRKQVMRWFAPECLDKFQFTTQSDIWSFGIVLWELLTRGVTPYPDVEPQNIKNYLNGGKRLKKPRQCPETLYLLMLQCWTEVPNDRPTFQEVHSEIEKFVTKDETNDVTEPLTTKIEPGGSSEYLEVVG